MGRRFWVAAHIGRELDVNVNRKTNMNGPHKNLKVWKDGMNLVTEVYRATSSFPKAEMYALASQMQRAAVSITSNIAEGYGRSTNKELIHFLHIALGSSNELDTQFMVALNLHYMEMETYTTLDSLNAEVNRMLRALIFRREAIDTPQPISEATHNP